MNQLIIIGASGHGKVVADIAEKNGYDFIRFLDDSDKAVTCKGYPVIGKVCSFERYDDHFFVAIGNASIRERIQRKLQASGKQVTTLIHPNAVIASGVEIGEGSVVMAGAVINPETIVGEGCIVNTCASVDHDCKLGDFVHVSVGAHLAGGCCIGAKTFVASGATVINNICICADCVIGAGSVVIRDIKTPGTYVGTPVRSLVRE